MKSAFSNDSGQSDRKDAQQDRSMRADSASPKMSFPEKKDYFRKLSDASSKRPVPKPLTSGRRTMSETESGRRKSSAEGEIIESVGPFQERRSVFETTSSTSTTTTATTASVTKPTTSKPKTSFISKIASKISGRSEPPKRASSLDSTGSKTSKIPSSDSKKVSSKPGQRKSSIPEADKKHGNQEYHYDNSSIYGLEVYGDESRIVAEDIYHDENYLDDEEDDYDRGDDIRPSSMESIAIADALKILELQISSSQTELFHDEPENSMKVPTDPYSLQHHDEIEHKVDRTPEESLMLIEQIRDESPSRDKISEPIEARLIVRSGPEQIEVNKNYDDCDLGLLDQGEFARLLIRPSVTSSSIETDTLDNQTESIPAIMREWRSDDCRSASPLRQQFSKCLDPHLTATSIQPSSVETMSHIALSGPSGKLQNVNYDYTSNNLMVHQRSGRKKFFYQMNEFTVPHVRSSRNSIDFDRCVRTWSYYAPLLTKEGTNLISSAVKIARVEVSQETGYPKYRYIARELLKSLEEGILERILFYCVEVLRVYSIDLGISINDLDVPGLSETLSHWSPSEAYKLKSNEGDPNVWFRLVDVRSITTQTSDLIKRVHRKVQTDRSFLMPSYRPPKILDELSKKKTYGQILSEYPEWIDEEPSRGDTTPESPESVIYNSAWGSSRATQTISDRDLNSEDVEYEYYYTNEMDRRLLEDIEEMEEELSLSAQEDYEDLLIANQAVETGLMALVAGEMAILASEIAISDEQSPLKPCVMYEKQNELPFLEDDGWENDHQRYLYRRRTSSLTRPKSTTSSPFTFSPPELDDESKEMFNYPSRSEIQPSRLSVHSTTSSCCSESKASQTDESEFEEEVVDEPSKLSSKPPIERKIKKLIISKSEMKSDHDEFGSFPSDETLEMQTFHTEEDNHADERTELSSQKTRASLKVPIVSSRLSPARDDLIEISRTAELESSSTQVYHDFEMPIGEELYPSPSPENPETMDIYWSGETPHALDDFYIGAVVSDAYSSYHPTRDHQLREVSAARFATGISDKSDFSHDNLDDDQFEVDFSQPIHPDDYLNHIQESIRVLQNHPAFDSPPSDPVLMNRNTYLFHPMIIQPVEVQYIILVKERIQVHQVIIDVNHLSR